MKPGVRVRTSPDYAQIMAELRKAKGAKVSVGVQGAQARTLRSTDDGDTITLAEIATVNEFGSSDGRIPARSFLRSTADARRIELNAVKRAALRSVASGKRTTEEALNLIGQWFAAAVQRTITELRSPPNAPSTIARKGSSKPLIDTGQLRQSITWAVRMGEGGGA